MLNYNIVLFYLRYDFTEYHDSQCAGNDGDDSAASGQDVQQDGEGVVDEHVAEEEGAEEEVAVRPDGGDLVGVALLLLVASVLDDLELGLVQGHQSQVEAGEET